MTGEKKDTAAAKAEGKKCEPPVAAANKTSVSAASPAATKTTAAETISATDSSSTKSLANKKDESGISKMENVTQKPETSAAPTPIAAATTSKPCAVAATTKPVAANPPKPSVSLKSTVAANSSTVGDSKPPSAVTAKPTSSHAPMTAAQPTTAAPPQSTANATTTTTTQPANPVVKPIPPTTTAGTNKSGTSTAAAQPLPHGNNNNPAAPPPTKKRKLHKPVPVTQLLSDHPVIQKTVHNLIGLLETYGPLTAGQLEYNLPPIVGERVNSQSIHDIVQVLVCMGIVQQVKEPPVPVGNSGVPTPPKPAAPPRYCIQQGVPRADVVLPHQVLEQIAAAHEEIKRSTERRKRLKEALQNKESPKELLKEIAIEYPEIAQDPVYATALKSFHLDLTMIERERRMRQQQQAMRAAAKKATSNTAAPNAPSEIRTIKQTAGQQQVTANPPKAPVKSQN